MNRLLFAKLLFSLVIFFNASNTYGYNLKYRFEDRGLAQRVAVVVGIDNKSYTGQIEIPLLVSPPDPRVVSVDTNGNIEYEECYVVEISDKAFDNCNFSSISFPLELEEIGTNAFQNCDNLTSMTIPWHIKKIGENIFKDCDNITTLTLNQLSFINTSEVDGSDNLRKKFGNNITTYILGEDIYKIPPHAFTSCTAVTSITLPSRLKEIGPSAFSSCKSLSSITIPNSVTSIGSFAFFQCTGLTSIDIPSNVTTIGDMAFNYSGITSITLPENLSTMGEGVFFDCTKLSSVTWSPSVKTINNETFRGCSSLTSIDIPDYITSIGDYAFVGCPLSSLSIPNSVTHIGKYAFWGCSKLTSITLPTTITTIEEGVFKGCIGLTSLPNNDAITSIGDYSFSGCTGLISISVPNNITSIGSHAFDECVNLNSLTISQNVKEIGEHSVSGCSSLFSITINSSYLTSPEGNPILFNEIFKEDIKEYILGSSITKIGNRTFSGCAELTSINIPTTVTSIGEEAFYGCSGLTSISLPTSVTSIGKGVFSKCIGLASISLPNSLTNISSAAFYNCDNLISINIPDGVSSIEAYAFYGCKSLPSITLPKNILSIGERAFYACENLPSIELPENLKAIGDVAFGYCIKFSNLSIPKNVENIGKDAFLGCSNLSTIILHCDKFVSKSFDYDLSCKAIFGNYAKKIIFGEEITEIGRCIFYGCDAITSIEMPNGLNVIGAGAFEKCSGLSIIRIPDNVTAIGASAFSYCSGLSELRLSDNLTTIGGSAFYMCNELTSVTIPQKVETIAGDAFNCNKLSTVYSKRTEPAIIHKSAFSNRYNAILYVPIGCKSKYELSTGWKDFKEIIETEIEDEPEDATIQFTDATVKALCVQNWDANSDGELSKEEAAAVTDISSVFQNKSNIISFNELQYFTGLTSIPNQAFEYCTNLSSIVIPANVKSIGGYAFNHCDNLKTLSMPENITSIGNGVLSSCGNLTSVTLPSDITMIPEAAFWGCAKLASIIIPTGVTSIGASAFRGCTALTEIVIPNNVVSIGTFAFNSCNNLSTITVGEKVETIANNAFLNCAPKKVTVNSNTLVSKNYSTSSSLADLFTDKVESYVLGSNITKIGDYAFYKCFQLREITLPSGLTYIGVNAFNYCNYLSSIVIPSSVTFLGAGAFNYCSGLTSVTVGWATPLAIGETDFSNRKNATLNVPQGSVSAYKAADYWKEFKNITSGTNVIDLSTATVELSYSESSFSYSGKQIKPTVTSVKINGSAKNISDFNITYGENVNAGNGTIFISGKNGDLYSGTATVSFVIYPRHINTVTVSSIPTQEYTGSPIEPTFTVTDGNPSIITTNDYTISYSNNIEPGEATITLTGKNNYKATKKVTFTISQTIIVIDPNDVVVTGVPETVLEGQDPDISKISVSYKEERLIRNLDYEISVNKSNKTITITFIGKYSGQITYNYTEEHVEKIAFADATVKTLCVQYWDTNGDGELSIEEAASVTSIDGVFAYNTSINTFEELQYFTGLKQIGSSAFSDCSGLTSITLPTSIERIERFAFSGCVGITSLSIPEGVQFIGMSAFENCSGISVLNLGDNVNTIEEDAFRNCSSLTAMVIPNGVTTIEPRTFQYCENLTTVVIPNAVTTIGERAFDGCKALTTATLPGSLKTIGGDAFTDCMFKSVVIPEGVISIGSRAFYHCTSLTSLTLPNSLTEIGYSAFQFASLKNIISNIENPFVIESSVFSTSNYNTATLNVPVGTIEKYRLTAAWNKFVNITDGSTGINGIYDSTSSDEKYYNANGIRQSNLKKGLNIVKNVNGQARKIIIK